MHLSAGGGRLAQELRPRLGSGSPVHPGVWRRVSQRSQLSPAPAGTRVVALSPPDSLRSLRPPRPWPHSFLGLRTRRARLDYASEPLETPGYSGTPKNFSASPEPAQTQADLLCTGYSRAQAQRPGASGGTVARLAAASILCSDCAFRAAGRLLPGGAGRARAASAEAGRGEPVGGGRWAGISAFGGEQRAPRGTGGQAGQARQGVPRAGRPAQPPSPRSPPSVPGSWAPPCPGYPPPRGHFVLELRGPACRSLARSLRQASRPRASAGGGEGFALEEPGVPREALPLPPPPKPCSLGSLEGRGVWGLLTT